MVKKVTTQVHSRQVHCDDGLRASSTAPIFNCLLKRSCESHPPSLSKPIDSICCKAVASRWWKRSCSGVEAGLMVGAPSDGVKPALIMFFKVKTLKLVTFQMISTFRRLDNIINVLLIQNGH